MAHLIYSIANEVTDPNLLAKLSKYSDLKSSVALNPNTPKEVLEGLAQDEDDKVKCYAARNPNISEETLDKLADDRSGIVKKAVASNPKTSIKALEKIIHNPHISYDLFVFTLNKIESREEKD